MDSLPKADTLRSVRGLIITGGYNGFNYADISAEVHPAGHCVLEDGVRQHTLLLKQPSADEAALCMATVHGAMQARAYDKPAVLPPFWNRYSSASRLSETDGRDPKFQHSLCERLTIV